MSAADLPFRAVADPVPEPFKRLCISDLEGAPPAPEFWVDALLPAGEVTLLGAHGGLGKSSLALLIVVCICAGLKVLDRPARRGRVLVFSAEDPACIVLWRLHRICGHLGVDPAALSDHLLLLDATECDAALYAEINDAGVRTGRTTSSYTALKAAADEFGADVLIVDNASDTYDADENSRPRVRGFIRALAALVRERQGALLLLAHVDKSAAKGFAGGQGYSGSTAWNNSVRSRLFLSEQDGRLILEHQKSNFGRKAEPFELEWVDGGVLTLASNATAGLIAASERTAVLGLIREFYDRGEYLATSQFAPGNAYKILHGDPAFPKRLDRNAFNRVLRDAERMGHLVREKYKTDGRKERERWRAI